LHTEGHWTKRLVSMPCILSHMRMSAGFWSTVVLGIKEQGLPRIVLGLGFWVRLIKVVGVCITYIYRIRLTHLESTTSSFYMELWV
jgi:hypothetical protein